jgi:speckle-type POZ protein
LIWTYFDFYFPYIISPGPIVDPKLPETTGCCETLAAGRRSTSCIMPAPGSAAADVDVPRSASAIVAGTLTGHHLLHIEGYSRIKDDTPNGKCIKSCPFRVGGSSWSIWYYPNGQSSEDTDFIDIFIFLVESATGPVKARIKFSLMDQDDEPVPSHTVSAVLYEFAVQGKAAGLHKFIAKEFLEASEHLKDDCFKILCDITIPGELRKEERVTASPFVVVPPSDMHKHLGDFLKAKDGVDVTFQVGGKTLIQGAQTYSCSAIAGFQSRTPWCHERGHHNGELHPY